jgi:hypothetical protein
LRLLFLKPWSFAVKALKNLPPPSDERLVAFFTRACTDVLPVSSEPPPEAANENKARHKWPVCNLAIGNDLMEHTDASAKVVLNVYAGQILYAVRELVDAARDSAIWGTDEISNRDEEDVDGDSFGWDRGRHMGPSAELLKRAWEEGADPSSPGEPWNFEGPWELLSKESATGRDVKALYTAGRLRFNEYGEIFLRRTETSGWFRERERVYAHPKGSRTQRPVPPDPVDLSLYTEAALPRGKTGEFLGGFVAGKTGSTASASNITDHSESKHREACSPFDPMVVRGAEDAARESATEQLADLRVRLGRRLYEALLGAATGETLYQIGGAKAKDQKASAVGRDRVVTAIEMLIEAGAPKSPSRKY